MKEDVMKGDGDGEWLENLQLGQESMVMYRPRVCTRPQPSKTQSMHKDASQDNRSCTLVLMSGVKNRAQMEDIIKGDEDEEWLKVCMVGIAKDWLLTRNMGEAIRKEHFLDIDVKPLGWDKVLLQFSSV
ncbi:hypothetical protein U1Q18_042976 [Sarracenia purpurea var. burkii]